MNVTNLLLGITSLLLVGAFAFSFNQFTSKQDDPDRQKEVAELKAKFEKIEEDREALELRQIRSRTAYIPPAPLPPTPETGSYNNPPAAPAVPAADPQASEDAKLAANLLDQLDRERAKNEKLEEDKVALSEENEVLEQENEKVFEEKTEEKAKQSKQAFRITNALPLGTVTEADRETGIVVFTSDPRREKTHSQGTVLAVRRNSGIVGKIEIQTMGANGEYLASMMPHGYSPDGVPEIQPGDTIITDHKYE